MVIRIRSKYLVMTPLLLALVGHARADAATVTVCSGALEPITVATCVAVAVAAHELFITETPFGKNGEGMKALRKPLGGKNSVFKKKWKL